MSYKAYHEQYVDRLMEHCNLDDVLPIEEPFESFKLFCVLCKIENHSVTNCPLSPEEKIKFLIYYKMCNRCLSDKHRSIVCPFDVTCNLCGLLHLEYIYHKSV